VIWRARERFGAAWFDAQSREDQETALAFELIRQQEGD